MDQSITEGGDTPPYEHPVGMLLERLTRSVEEAPLRGAGGAAHLHLFDFAWLAPLNPLLYSFLDETERHRGERFCFPDDARRYERGRGVLRWLLGAYLGRGPERLAFDYSGYGRPSLRHEGIEFNVSHTRRYLALAFVRDGAVGVDVEGDRGTQDLLRIARRFFAAAEYEKLAALQEDQRTRAFLRCWTQKEAYIKAHGVGLSMPLNRFEVGVLPEEPCGLLAAHDDSAELQRWQFVERHDLENAHVAMVVEGVGREVTVWRWGCEPKP